MVTAQTKTFQKCLTGMERRMIKFDSVGLYLALLNIFKDRSECVMSSYQTSDIINYPVHTTLLYDVIFDLANIRAQFLVFELSW